MKALSLSDKLAKLPKQQVEDLLNPDDLLNKFAVKVQNQTFDKQKEIHKILLEEVGGEDSEYESDLDELSTLENSTSAQVPPVKP
jgi:hypothetical protein